MGPIRRYHTRSLRERDGCRAPAADVTSGNNHHPAAIITADDFGYTASANRAIVRSLQEGLVSHASVMVNTPWFEEACDLARQTRVEARVGLHLNLAEGVPLTDAMRGCPRFCINGRYIDPDVRERFVPLSRGEQRAVAGEIRAQIAAARERGLAIRHLDSHRYVHTAPNLARVIARIARELQVPRVRPYYCPPSSRGLRTLGKSAYNAWLSMRGFRHVRFFGSIDDILWLGRRGRLVGGSVEVMTHPLLGDAGVLMDGEEGQLIARLSQLAPWIAPIGATIP